MDIVLYKSDVYFGRSLFCIFVMSVRKMKEKNAFLILTWYGLDSARPLVVLEPL